MIDAYTIPEAFRRLVPRYKSCSHGPITICVKWEPKYAHSVATINPKRATDRISNYIIPTELARARARLDRGKKDFSLRFGKEKPGRGYYEERGDFCLVAGAVDGRRMTVFHRSLECIGGWAYDLCVIEYVNEQLDLKLREVTFMAAKAHVFALKRNSNEALYPKLQRIFK